MFLPEIPAGLERAEFTRAIFVLEFQNPCDLTIAHLLRLRRELLQATSVLAAVEGSAERSANSFRPTSAPMFRGVAGTRNPLPPLPCCLKKPRPRFMRPVTFCVCRWFSGARGLRPWGIFCVRCRSWGDRGSVGGRGALT